MCFEYHRVFHLVILLAIVALYIADLVTNIVFQRGLRLDNWGWAIGVLVLLILWFLRGRLFMRWSFPIFHYGTLLVEWIVSLLAFLFYCIYIFYISVSLNQKTLSLSIAIGIITLLIAISYLLLFILYAHKNFDLNTRILS